MFQHFLEIIDRYNIPAECSVNFGAGILNILGKQFKADLPKGKRMLSVSNESQVAWETILGWPVPECVERCVQNNWRVIGTANGDIHVYNALQEYIGPLRDAVILLKMGILSPRSATAFLDTQEYPTHFYCTIGYSEVLGRAVCWSGGDFFTASSLEEAAKHSCQNSVISFRDTMAMRDKVCNFWKLSNKPAVVSETKEPDSGLNTIYGEIISDIKNKLSPKAETFSLEPECPTADECGTGAKEPVTVGVDLEGNKESESGIIGDNSGAGMGSITVVHGKRSGEHRQHRTVSPSRIDRSVMPQSGDHKQHNIPKLNPNPGYRMPMVEMGSESSAKNNPLAYTWHRFNPASGRAKNFPNAHRHYELRLEANDVYGYREGRGDTVYLVDKEDISIEFKLTKKELAALLKVSKPFKGKIAGKPVTAIKKAEAAPAAKSEKAKPSNEQPKEIYVGLFQSSIHVEEYDLIFDVNRKNLLADIEERASNIKQSVPRAIIVKLPTNHPLVKPNLSIKRPRVLKNMADHLIRKADSKPQIVNFSKRLQQYSMKPRTPKVGGLQPKEPVYSGNEHAVLLEIRNAILHGHYSVEFRPASISKGAIKFLDASNAADIKNFGVLRNPDRLVLAVNNVSPLFKAEAEAVVSRIQRDYPKVLVKRGGKPIEDSVIRHTVKTMTFGDEDYQVLIIALRLPKRGESDVVRSKKLHDLTKNMNRVESMTALLKSIDDGQTKINNLAKRMETDKDPDLRKQLAILMASQEDRAKAANELSKTTLVLNAPIYSIQKGKSWLTVEVVDYDIYKGTVTVRQVRGGNRNKEEVTSLWTFAGHKQVI